MLHKRNIINQLLTSLKKSPVVLLNGARQVGKSTLIEELIKSTYKAKYITLDDHGVLLALSQDPYGYLDAFKDTPMAIDEVQRCSELFLAIKRIVDKYQKDGSYLLTGSANILTLPKLSESLAGRMIIHPMWPLSQGELLNTKELFLNWLYTTDHKVPIITNKIISNQDLINKVLTGGYPRAIKCQNDNDRKTWFKSYIDTIIQRDIKNLANIEGLAELPNLLSIISERVGSLLNLADISRALGINQITLKRYYTLLQTVFLIIELPAWFHNREKRLVKSPKVFLNDTGILSYFTQLDYHTLIQDRSKFGGLLENFVVMELKKQISWHNKNINMFHFRTNTNHEVDIILEGYGKKIVGIEVKASTKIDKKDLKGLIYLKELAKDKFHKGIILYTGEQILPLGNNIIALPIQSLWDLNFN